MTTGVSEDAVISSPNRVDTQLRHESSDPPPLTLDAMIADGATISSLRAVQARLADGDLAALAAVETKNYVPHGPGFSFAALKRDARGVAFETSTVWV